MIGGSPRPFAPTFGRFASGTCGKSIDDLRHVRDRRDLVVVEVRVDRHARRRIDDELLGERERHPLQHAALDLARRGQRIDDPPDVVDGDDPLDAHLAERGVDGDLRDLTAEGVDDEAVGVRAARAGAVDRRVAELLRHLGHVRRRSRRHCERMRPSRTSRSSTAISKTSPASWSSVLRTLAAAERTAGITDGVVCEPPATGRRRSGPCRRRPRARGRAGARAPRQRRSARS